ncbi:hypothetical protein [Actinoplanes auranticolor]|uniref:Uncharacterized protein n=1 Tax=Actinoplanes auranticolor TaxID=47988 RepID=A0A919VRR7_9ACTN|nr:hypothetical protein [Actinoplanes auranticolor]GIM76344.1 hypothetical protein Aau02nite_70440 [Actinoplanes auranticolor]
MIEGPDDVSRLLTELAGARLPDADWSEAREIAAEVAAELEGAGDFELIVMRLEHLLALRRLGGKANPRMDDENAREADDAFQEVLLRLIFRTKRAGGGEEYQESAAP